MRVRPDPRQRTLHAFFPRAAPQQVLAQPDAHSGPMRDNINAALAGEQAGVHAAALLRLAMAPLPASVAPFPAAFADALAQPDDQTTLPGSARDVLGDQLVPAALPRLAMAPLPAGVAAFPAAFADALAQPDDKTIFHDSARDFLGDQLVPAALPRLAMAPLPAIVAPFPAAIADVLAQLDDHSTLLGSARDVLASQPTPVASTRSAVLETVNAAASKRYPFDAVIPDSQEDSDNVSIAMSVAADVSSTEGHDLFDTDIDGGYDADREHEPEHQEADGSDFGDDARDPSLDSDEAYSDEHNGRFETIEPDDIEAGSAWDTEDSMILPPKDWMGEAFIIYRNEVDIEKTDESEVEYPDWLIEEYEIQVNQQEEEERAFAEFDAAEAEAEASLMSEMYGDGFESIYSNHSNALLPGASANVLARPDDQTTLFGSTRDVLVGQSVPASTLSAVRATAGSVASKWYSLDAEIPDSQADDDEDYDEAAESFRSESGFSENDDANLVEREDQDSDDDVPLAILRQRRLALQADHSLTS